MTSKRSSTAFIKRLQTFITTLLPNRKVKHTPKVFSQPGDPNFARMDLLKDLLKKKHVITYHKVAKNNQTCWNQLNPAVICIFLSQIFDPSHPGCTGEDVLYFSLETLDIIGGWGTGLGPKWVIDTVNKCCSPVFEVGFKRIRNKETFEETIPWKSWISRRQLWCDTYKIKLHILRIKSHTNMFHTSLFV